MTCKMIQLPVAEPPEGVREALAWLDEHFTSREQWAFLRLLIEAFRMGDAPQPVERDPVMAACERSHPEAMMTEHTIPTGEQARAIIEKIQCETAGKYVSARGSYYESTNDKGMTKGELIAALQCVDDDALVYIEMGYDSETIRIVEKTGADGDDAAHITLIPDDPRIIEASGLRSSTGTAMPAATPKARCMSIRR
jgi:hypothetical protein